MKVLASDFDNTLYFKNLKDGFKECDIEAMKEFQDKGNLFGICTGRPLVELLEVIHGIIEPDFYIVSTGAIIYDHDYHVLFAQKLPYDIANEIAYTYQDEVELLPQTQSLDKVYTTKVDDINDYIIHISSLADLNGLDIYSLSLIESTVLRAGLMTQEMNEKYENVKAYQNIDSVDIVARGCSKGAAIRQLKNC